MGIEQRLAPAHGAAPPSANTCVPEAKPCQWEYEIAAGNERKLVRERGCESDDRKRTEDKREAEARFQDKECAFYSTGNIFANT